MRKTERSTVPWPASVVIVVVGAMGPAISGCRSVDGGKEVTRPALLPEDAGIEVEKGVSYRVGDAYLTGQPTPAGLEAARDAGIKTVINLRAPSEQADYDERARVEELGLRYANVVVTPEPDDATVEEFLAALQAAERPVLIHCASGNRVGGFWAIHLARDLGVEQEEALLLGEKSGMSREKLRAFVKDYLERTSSPRAE